MFNLKLHLTLISWVTLCDVPNTVRFLTACLHGTYGLWKRKTNDQVNECYRVCLTKGSDWGGKRKSCFGELRSLAPTWIMSEVNGDTHLSAKCDSETRGPTDRSSQPKSIRSSENWVRIIAAVS